MDHLIGCREAVARLWRFLDGELEPSAVRSLEDHLDRCVTCCGELQFARKLRLLLDLRPQTDFPATVRAHLEQFVDEMTGAGMEGEIR